MKATLSPESACLFVCHTTTCRSTACVMRAQVTPLEIRINLQERPTPRFMVGLGIYGSLGLGAIVAD